MFPGEKWSKSVPSKKCEVHQVTWSGYIRDANHTSYIRWARGTFLRLGHVEIHTNVKTSKWMLLLLPSWKCFSSVPPPEATVVTATRTVSKTKFCWKNDMIATTEEM